MQRHTEQEIKEKVSCFFLSQIKGNTVNNIKTKQEGKRYKRWISFMPLAFWEFTT